MWGWKAVTRHVEQVQLVEATQALAREGFDTYRHGDDYALLKRRGKRRAGTGRQAPLDVKLFKDPAQQSLEMHIAYDKFALFDTGDLRREADRLQGVLSPGPSEA